MCAVVSEDLMGNDEAGSGRVVAFQSRAKKPLWTAKLGGACLGDIACDGARCYVGARDGRFYAIDLATGTTAWQIDCRKMVASSRPIMLDGEAVPELKPRVWADGHVELVKDWVLFSVSHQIIEEPSALVVADKQSGKTIWVAQHPAKLDGRFGVAHDRVFVATQDRQLLSILLSDGQLAFVAHLPKADRGEFAGVTLDNGFLFLAGADATVSRMSLNSLVNHSR
jgi:hypothetical protein